MLRFGVIESLRSTLKDTKGLKEAHVFGSYAKGNFEEGSDIDLLVQIKRPVGFIKLNSLQLSLESVLKKKVDLVEYEAVGDVLRPFISRDETLIYEE